MFQAVHASKPEILTKYKDENGFFIKRFFMNDTFNFNRWSSTWEGMQRSADTVIGKPQITKWDCEAENVCVMTHITGPTYEQALEIQVPYTTGIIVGYELDDATHTLKVYEKITDRKIQSMFENKEILYNSPSVWPVSEHNTPSGTEMDSWVAAHNANVTEPAYGQTQAVIYDSCKGTDGECSVRLKNASKYRSVVKHKDHMHYASTSAAPCESRAKAELNLALRMASIFLKTASTETGPDGKKGHWITVRGNRIFIPLHKKVVDVIRDRIKHRK
ncbi:MAG: hypothetical protein K8823_1562 [Cenarchaeum symbiont of Oopsacas minuta]|nr:hypothetical protein [Cenarchaeum symbiont of Oopsacas minuta]